MRSASPTLRALAVAVTALWAPAFAQQGPSAVSAPASPQPAAPAPAASQARTADEAFNTRVRTLEEQVVDLKEKIYRSKARLQLLQETVLGGDLSTGARAVLVHRNEMGDSFVLESVAYALDGAPIYTRTDEASEELSKNREFEIFKGRIVPGQHQVAVRLVYRGHGYGVFSYLEGYRFKVQSSYTFNAEPGKVTTVRVVGFEKGGLTTDLQDRPAVRYDLESSRDAGKPSPAPDAAPPPPAAASETK
ncbi:dihydrolipoamide acetyltransferase [Archangium gephyra]|uniref:dihydrolipoamide acetyltransferase n=1 Tax=Archangium gephyra TaxID=48 RepID=UPI0035D4BB5E